MPESSQRLDIDFPWDKHRPLQSDLQKLMSRLEARFSGSEGDISRLDDLQGSVISNAEEQMQILLQPAVDKMEALTELGFLIARSTSNFQPFVGVDQVMVIDAGVQRDLFFPTEFVTLTRAANYTDWAIARVLDWSPANGNLVLRGVYKTATAGAATDWYVSATAAETPAVVGAIADFNANKDAVLQAAVSTAADRIAVSADRSLVSQDKSTAQTAVGSAQTAASAAEASATAANAAADRAEDAEQALDPAAFETRVSALETGKAPLASPVLTGHPTGVTEVQADNSTRLSTTAYVRAAVTALLGGVGGTGDTLKKLFDLIPAQAASTAYVDAAVALRAPIASPTLTGSPAAPTPTPGDNTTHVATTAFVSAAITAAVNALLNGVGSAGDTLKELYDLIVTKVTATNSLTAVASVTPATDTLPYFTSGTTADVSGLSAFARTMLDDANAATMRATLGAGNCALDVEDQTITGGGRVTLKDLGNLSGQTITPDPGDRPMQKITNNGAGTLAPGANPGCYLLDVVNTTGAGVITVTGWTKVLGAFDVTTTSKFRCHASISADMSVLAVQKVV